MSDVAIKVEGLGKRYRIGGEVASYDTLRDRIAATLKSPARRLRKGLRHMRSNGRPASEEDEAETIWALKDLSFEVPHGQVLGVIGHNGAGKSTLLKVLARITEPTEGYARVHGRVGSLLEVGTGFHPELSGRENVYLNGAILGMHRDEIDQKFDEIIAFAEVEKFVDTPVKHYSSGMYLRLAFAVAAHLEPEILVIDEVLAVGDASFQKKCLQKMGDTAKGGRTIVFVSHDLSAVLHLCPRTILLENGRIAAEGPSATVIDQYLESSTSSTAERVWAPGELDTGKSDVFRPLAMRVVGDDGLIAERFRSVDPLWIEIEYELRETVENLRVGIYLYSAMGELLFISLDRDDVGRYRQHQTQPAGRYVSRCRIPPNLLNRGGFIVGLTASIYSLGLYCHDPYALRFRVDATGGVGSQWKSAANRSGYFRPALEWEIRPVEKRVTVSAEAHR